MKAITLTSILFFTLNIANSQTNGPCKGDSSATILSAANTRYFFQSGINLNAYDWSSPYMNCQINSMVVARNHARSLGIWSGVALGFGGAIVVGSILGTAYVIAYYGAFSWVGPGFILGGGAITLGGFSLHKKSQAQKTEMNIHLTEVENYYRVNNLY